MGALGTRATTFGCRQKSKEPQASADRVEIHPECIVGTGVGVGVP